MHNLVYGIERIRGIPTPGLAGIEPRDFHYGQRWGSNNIKFIALAKLAFSDPDNMGNHELHIHGYK